MLRWKECDDGALTDGAQSLLPMQIYFLPVERKFSAMQDCKV
jgi:hypothetical protein